MSRQCSGEQNTLKLGCAAGIFLATAAIAIAVTL
jgi:hypothetical protein